MTKRNPCLFLSLILTYFTVRVKEQKHLPMYQQQVDKLYYCEIGEETTDPHGKPLTLELQVQFLQHLVRVSE